MEDEKFKTYDNFRTKEFMDSVMGKVFKEAKLNQARPKRDERPRKSKKKDFRDGMGWD